MNTRQSGEVTQLRPNITVEQITNQFSDLVNSNWTYFTDQLHRSQVEREGLQPDDQGTYTSRTGHTFTLLAENERVTLAEKDSAERDELAKKLRLDHVGQLVAIEGAARLIQQSKSIEAELGWSPNCIIGRIDDDHESALSMPEFMFAMKHVASLTGECYQVWSNLWHTSAITLYKHSDVEAILASSLEADLRTASLVRSSHPLSTSIQAHYSQDRIYRAYDIEPQLPANVIRLPKAAL